MIDSWGQNIYQHVTGNDRKFILISFHHGFCHNLLDTKGREKIRQNGNFVQKYPRGKGPCSIAELEPRRAELFKLERSRTIWTGYGSDFHISKMNKKNVIFLLLAYFSLHCECQ